MEYECGSPALLAQVKKTKFRTVAGFGHKVRGHIELTYHHDEASFRNLKLRELPAIPGGAGGQAVCLPACGPVSGSPKRGKTANYPW
ncbi:MAG: hypothetical protein HYV75_03230 [Opitutae bacterium]|nr:hypothetical protein [Opitutae bacterium]